VTGRLRCYSFHSVKGGVGKSTLSVVSALGLAQQGHRVTLIDMDLTGTSLADVLPLEAPRWKAVSSAQEVLPLLRKPDDFWSPKETEKLIPQRDLALREREKHAPIGVPFLNDFLLFATEDWDGQDAPVETMLWRMKGVEGPGTLHIVPSSALPPDLEQTLPVIFDEQHSAFLESRLEYLLDALVPDEGEAVVVVDTPPTIPGLSRSVLSLALRLGGEKKIPLSKDGGMPRRLEQAEIHWTAFLVMSMDPQDLRAAARWLSLASPEEQNQLRPLINRAPPGDPQQLMHMVKDIVEIGNGEANPLLEHPAWVPEAAGFRVFRSEDPRTLSVEALNFLEVLSG
jgi:hypothetical protein